MAWRLEGKYFESCSCDAICPCTWSALTAKATLDRCRALLAYHVESGEIDGVDVSGLSFALFLDTPPVMSEGNWRVGVFLDEAASDSQAAQLGTVLSGQAGGQPDRIMTFQGDEVLDADVDGVADPDVMAAIILHYGSYRGRLRDLRVGAHHGGYCLGCCWALMVILIAVGVMNVAAMVGLAALVLIEKTWTWGPAAGRLAGTAVLALAVATIWFPWLAPGLHAAPAMMS